MMFTSFAATDGICRQPETIGQTISIANPWTQEMIGVPMFTAYVVVTLLAIAANAFSGVAALVLFTRVRGRGVLGPLL